MARDFVLPHLPLGPGEQERFTSPRGGPQELRIPQRQRDEHGARLLESLRSIEGEFDGSPKAARITLLGQADYDLKSKSATHKRSGTEILVAGRNDADQPFAVVRMSGRGFEALERKVSQYATETTRKGRPRHEDFVAGIESVRLSLLRELWIGPTQAWPADEESPVWWELWLLGGTLHPEDARGKYLCFCDEARKLDVIGVTDKSLQFPERQVLLLKMNVRTLGSLVAASDVIAEVHPPSQSTVQYFVGCRHPIGGVEDLIARIVPLREGAEVPRVALIDTGVNHHHPLLLPAMAPNGVHTVDQSSLSTADYKPHGTQVAGIAAYGDISALLTQRTPIGVTHLLESVRIPLGSDHTRELWGQITKDAVQIVEDAAPCGHRVFNMSIGAEPSLSGRPTSWSAAVDSTCYNDGYGRVMTVAAGNVKHVDGNGYVSRNLSSVIDDPCQALNAICVGGVTDLVDPVPPLPNAALLASRGELSPHSPSGTARRAIKPDVICEAGNVLWDGCLCDTCYDGLCLLTTNADLNLRPLTTDSGTSLAAAAAARMLALIWADNPSYKPATIRGLLVHSARWTDALQKQFGSRRDLIRACGYGVPDLDAARRSAKSAVTLVVEDELRCGLRERVGGRATTVRDMAVHRIPWPQELLVELGELKVELRVTLSFFAEPNPKQYDSSYAGAILAWDMKGPSETEEQFLGRVNEARRDDGRAHGRGEIRWSVGPKLRNRGTVQSDRWVCTAAELASCGCIGVYPRYGWWKDNQRQRPDPSLPYSLIVSVITEDADVDLYVPIEQAISVQIPIGSML